MIKKLLLSMTVLAFVGTSSAQTNINIHSIANSRQPTGDTGYTLDGSFMTGSRAKLLNVANFGFAGTYGKTVSIYDGWGASGSLENIADSNNIDLLYFGIFDTSDSSLIQFTSAEIDSLFNWSMQGGKLIIGAGSALIADGFNPNVLNPRWSFDLALANPSPFIPNAFGVSTDIFNGPFGIVNNANQGGSSQGYFTSYPTDVVVLADDGIGNPTMYLDCKTLDLVVADGDAFTSLGGITEGNTITSSNDILWANVITYMDLLQGQPTITQTGGTLLSTGTYSSYQWFLNGELIPGANQSTYNMSQTGSYSLRVMLDCGCANMISVNAVGFVGLDEMDHDFLLTIFPNPAKENIQIKGLSELVDVRKIEINSISGENIYSVSEIADAIDVSRLPQGFYFVDIFYANGTKSLKFLKQ